MADDHYVNIRDIDQLGRVVGAKVVDITQHDQDEFAETKEAYVCFHFDNGIAVKFPIGDDGFDVDTPE